jgi:hypothetical protein
MCSSVRVFRQVVTDVSGYAAALAISKTPARPEDPSTGPRGFVWYGGCCVKYDQTSPCRCRSEHAPGFWLNPATGVSYNVGVQTSQYRNN